MQIVNKPDLKTIAGQLRKPSGKMAEQIAAKMNVINNSLYDFVLDVMNLRENENILEVGFGNGKFFSKLFSRSPNLRISGIDYSTEMVKAAIENNKNEIKTGRLKLHRGNSNDLPYQDEYFDKVFCNNVIYFWDHPGRHLKEINRVLKPGGKFYSGLRSKESTQAMPFSKFGFNLYETDEWRSLLRNNGFDFIEAKQKYDPVIEDEGEEYHLESICYIGEKNKPGIIN